MIFFFQKSLKQLFVNIILVLSLLQVIEAVYENMELKKEIFGKLDRVCKSDAILCSNTTYLDLDEVRI